MDRSKKTGGSRRRWFQYSLWSLLLLTAVVAVWIGLETRQARRRERVMARVQELDGKVGTYYRLTGTQQKPGPAWFWDFIGKGYALHIADIRLFGTSADDRDLEEIGSLRHLRDVSLDDCGKITDHGLAYLKPTGVFSLTLGSSIGREYNITPNGIKDVVGCPTLEALVLLGPHVDDTWLTALHDARQLKILGLAGDTRYSEAGIAALRKALPQLDIHTPQTLAVSLGLPADAMRPVRESDSEDTLPPDTPPLPSVADDGLPGYDSPERAFQAYTTGAVTHDFDLMLSALTRESRAYLIDAVVSSATLMFGKNPAMQKILREHGVTAPFSSDQQTKPDEQALVDAMLKIKDPGGLARLVTDHYLKQAQRRAESNDSYANVKRPEKRTKREIFEIVSAVTVENVKITGDMATASIKTLPPAKDVLNEQPYTANFRRIKNRWYYEIDPR